MCEMICGYTELQKIKPEFVYKVILEIFKL